MGLIPFRALPCILLLMVLSAGCAPLHPPTVHPPDMALPGTPGTLFLAEGQHLAKDDLARLVPDHDFILIGESHTNTCDHRFQKDALLALSASNQDLALGLEMVPWSAQDILDDFNRGVIDLEELEEKLGWREYWGYSFSLYSPILAQARELGIPVLGLNVPKELLHRVRTDGMESIPPDDRGLLPHVIIPPPPQQESLLEEEFSLHIEMMPERTAEAGFELERFILIQSLWDTQMAFSAIHWQNTLERPLVILAGSGHVEYGHGIPHRLRVLEPASRILTLVPWRGGPTPDPDSGDLFYFCPEQPRRLGMVIAWIEDRAILSDVLPESLADQSGLQPGDVLISANDVPITALEVLHQAGMQAVRSGEPLYLEVLRNGTHLLLEVIFP
ncbi:ChaN family lipoprotein [Desulfonatronum parangueonense]